MKKFDGGLGMWEWRNISNLENIIRSLTLSLLVATSVVC